MDFEVQASGFNEDLDRSQFPTPEEYCVATCLGKAELVRDRTMNDARRPVLIVSSDTIMASEGKIYEKPIDRSDGVRMLREISGKTIQVITAVTMIYSTRTGGHECHSFHDVSDLIMDHYGLDMINAYLDTGSGMDHSCALALSEECILMVKGIRGCYHNLIGFPATKFYREFLKIAPSMGL